MERGKTYMEDAKINSLALDKARYHAWFHHNDSDGWITVAKKYKNGSFRQYHYKPEELAEILSEWIDEDVYFSQNTFYRPQRQIVNIRQLKSLYVDVDFYLLNYDPDWVLGKLEYEYFGKIVPEPNLVIFSGRGIVLIWLIEPVPYMALPLWQAIQANFLAKLKDLGGDSNASDAARVFRLAGSVNSQNGKEVQAQYRHDYRYELKQVQFDYLPDLNEVVHPPGKKKKGRKKKVVHLFNIYRLYHTRLLDLVKLVELRNYDVEGYRETICFLYRYWSCCFLEDPDQALNDTQMFNLQFINPLPLKEVEKATKSAEKAYNARNNEKANKMAIQKGYPGAGYNISNKKLIGWLDVTEEEEKHLSTIIGANEKRRRKRIANIKMRRDQGIKSRQEYLSQFRAVKQKGIELKERGMKYREIAEELDVSIDTVKGWFRKNKV